MIKPDINYLTQRDNVNPFTGKPDGHNQCMVASFTMVMNWLGNKYNIDYLKIYTESMHLLLVGKNINMVEKLRYNSDNHASVCNYILSLYDIKIRFKKYDCDFEQMKKLQSNRNCPVIIGTMISSVGHIVVYADGFYYDPYGKCSELTGKYGNDFDGNKIVYSDNFSANNVFRNQKRRIWVVE